MSLWLTWLTTNDANESAEIFEGGPLLELGTLSRQHIAALVRVAD
jgi:hypothetical protein